MKYKTKNNNMISKKILCAAMILFLGTSSGLANVRSENVETKKTSERAFLVSYSDGTKEKILVTYVAKMYHKLWQTGKSSTLDHLVDNRKCHWAFDSTVNRKAFFVHRTGIKAPLESFNQIYHINKNGDRGADNFFESLTYHRTCGDSMGQYNSVYSSVHNGLLSGFNGILNEDRKNAASHLKNLLGATSVVIQ
jgi:hypothetical protein